MSYDAGFQANGEARAAFQAAVDVWAQRVKSTVPIRVQASFTDLGFTSSGSLLGSAGPSSFIQSFPNQPDRNVLYPLPLANALSGSEQDPNPANGCSCDIQAQFNDNANIMPTWYFGLDGRPSSSQSDFESVVMHELGHGLGFGISLMTVDGSGQGSYSFPTVWDDFAFTGSGNKRLLDTTAFPNPSAALGTALTTDQGIVFSGVQTTAAGGPGHLFTPPSWSPGSSYGHFDQRGVLGAPSSGTNFYPDGSANGLMRPVMARGSSYHDPGPLMLGMFKDMGWQLNVAPFVSEAPNPVNA
ncbi:MAG: hypothetical protein JOY57_15495, partial [Actinobacteria bacterium]|nr:hypothetical protein [Actinomycetota bacterium]